MLFWVREGIRATKEYGKRFPLDRGNRLVSYSQSKGMEVIKIKRCKLMVANGRRQISWQRIACGVRS